MGASFRIKPRVLHRHPSWTAFHGLGGLHNLVDRRKLGMRVTKSVARKERDIKTVIGLIHPEQLTNQVLLAAANLARDTPQEVHSHFYSPTGGVHIWLRTRHPYILVVTVLRLGA